MSDSIGEMASALVVDIIRLELKVELLVSGDGANRRFMVEMVRSKVGSNSAHVGNVASWRQQQNRHNRKQ